MNKEERITYDEFMTMFKFAPRMCYTLYDKAEDEIEQLRTELNSKDNIINELEKELQEGSFDVYFCSTNTQKTFKSNDIIIKSLILDKLKELKENK